MLKKFLPLLRQNSKRKFNQGNWLLQNFLKGNYNNLINIDFSKKFSTFQKIETNLFNVSKLIRTEFKSLFDVPSDWENKSVEEIENEIYEFSPKSIFNVEKMKLNVSIFLQAFEFARPYNVKFSKYQQFRNEIPMIDKDDIKQSLFSLMSDKSIKDKKLESLKSSMNELLKIQSSYESIDRNTSDKTEVVISEIGKFILSNNIYNTDHTVNYVIKGNKELVYSLSDVKILLEDLKFSDFNESQIIRIVPIIVMLNNIYSISNIVLDNLFEDLMRRLFNPLEKASKENENTIFSYFMFFINNNILSKPDHIKSLVVFKDVILKRNNINDLLYILTANIFKFVNKYSSTSDDLPNTDEKLEQEKETIFFEEFLNAYFEEYKKITDSDRANINPIIFKNFLLSILILNDYNLKKKDCPVFSVTTIQKFKTFLEIGVFNALDHKSYYKKAIFKMLANKEIFLILLEIDNKIFNFYEKSKVNLVLNLYTVGDCELMTEFSDDIEYQDFINLLLYFNNYSDNQFECKRL